MGYYSGACLSVYPKRFCRGRTGYRQDDTCLDAGHKLRNKIYQKIKFNTSYRFNIVNQESGKYTHHAVAAIEFKLTRMLDLDLSFVWDRIQDPEPAADGQVPNQDDFYFFFGIGFDL
jgi:hypothetical protein